MKNITLIFLGIIYLLCTFRVGNSIVETLKATAPQFVMVSFISLVVALLIISIAQLSGDKNKVPWFRRIQLFFAIGILIGFGTGLVEYFWS
jgi:hypothetical protein